jgi:hypothetical protein
LPGCDKLPPVFYSTDEGAEDPLALVIEKEDTPLLEERPVLTAGLLLW